MGDDAKFLSNMVMFIRAGAIEMLELLSEYCNLYAYSHGFKCYIKEVLAHLDPDKKYFKDLDKHLVAPLHKEE